MNLSYPFVPNPLSEADVRPTIGALLIPHPAIPGRNRETASKLFTAVEERVALNLGPGNSRIYAAEAFFSYRQFYSLFLEKFAENSTKGLYFPRILYAPTLPAAAIEALRDLETKRRVKLVRIDVSPLGIINIEALKRQLSASSNALLISLPYISRFGHQMTAEQIQLIGSIGLNALSTALHLDLTYYDWRDNARLPEGAGAYTADLGFVDGINDMHMIYLIKDLQAGLQLDLQRWRENHVAAAHFLQARRTAPTELPSSAAHMAILRRTKEALARPPNLLLQHDIKFIPFSELPQHSYVQNALITLNDLGAVAGAGWLPGVMIFAILRQGKPVSSKKIIEYVLTTKAYCHAVDLGDAAGGGTAELDRPILREMIIVTTPLECLPELMRHAFVV